MRSTPIGIISCVFSAFLLTSCNSASDLDSTRVSIGSRVPNFSLKSLDGATVTSRSFEGNVVVLNFWATFCAPCLKEIPDLKQMASSGTKVIGIALDEDGVKVVKPFAERMGINAAENYTVLLGDQELFQRFNGFGIPYTLLLDRSQRIVKIYRGPTTRESLEQDLKAISHGA